MAFLLGCTDDGCGLRLDLPLQYRIEQLLGMQTDDARMGGDLVGVLVQSARVTVVGVLVQSARVTVAAAVVVVAVVEECMLLTTTMVVVVLVVKGRLWSLYPWRINNANIINNATGFNVDTYLYRLFGKNPHLLQL